MDEADFTNKNWDFLYIQESKTFQHRFSVSHDTKASEPKATFSSKISV